MGRDRMATPGADARHARVVGGEIIVPKAVRVVGLSHSGRFVFAGLNEQQPHFFLK